MEALRFVELEKKSCALGNRRSLEAFVVPLYFQPFKSYRRFIPLPTPSSTMISLLPTHAPSFFPSLFETGKGYHMLSADSKLTRFTFLRFSITECLQPYRVQVRQTKNAWLSEQKVYASSGDTTEPSLID